MTCKVGHEGDYRVLDRNKFKIIYNILHGGEFTSNELFEFREAFGESDVNSFNGWLLRKGCTQREYLFGSILQSSASLEFVNQVLSCDEEVKLTRHNKITFLQTIVNFSKCLNNRFFSSSDIIQFSLL